MTMTNPAAAALAATGSYAWTKGEVSKPLRSEPFSDIVTRVKAALVARHLEIPDLDRFVNRVVTALLAGHVILQGPPGTGKTTIAKVLAEAFFADLQVTTATSEWSTYDVIGGLQPTLAGAFQPKLGAASQAALDCADTVRTSGATGTQATWLLIDEFNRADIDKAIGPLYTVLSSTAASELEDAPIELWFERGDRRKLWVPTRFRIIGTMNDVDTSFVNALSQGLTRRFQFIPVPVATGSADAEVAATLQQASERWASERGSAIVGTYADISAALAGILQQLRDPDGIGWPLGSAQALDVWRAVLIRTEGDEANLVDLAQLDEAMADIVAPQAAMLSLPTLQKIRETLDDAGLALAGQAIAHLENTSATQF